MVRMNHSRNPAKVSGKDVYVGQKEAKELVSRRRHLPTHNLATRVSADVSHVPHEVAGRREVRRNNVRRRQVAKLVVKAPSLRMTFLAHGLQAPTDLNCKSIGRNPPDSCGL